MSPTQSVIVFVHGAWFWHRPHKTWLNIIKAKGFKVYAPRLVSPGLLTHPDPTAEDVKMIAELVNKLADEGKEIICICHSYGGVVASEAMVGLSLEARKARGLQGGVKRMIYIASFLLTPGVCLEDLAPIDLIPQLEYKDGLKGFAPGADLGAFFFPDISPEEQQYQLDDLVPHPAATSFHKPTATAYGEIPATIVYCDLDKAFSIEGQKAMAGFVKAHGVQIDEYTLPSAHYPALSMPEKLADICLKYF